MNENDIDRSANSERTRSAISALRPYARGSGRGQLLPLDQLSSESLTNPVLRGELERELIRALEGHLSDCAVEYVCGKLGMLGTAESVPALARLLSQPDTSEAALAALRSIPDKAASKALRQRLRQRDLPGQVSVIHAVGFRRDPESVPALIQLLEGEDTELQAPAAVALGQIGNLEAARALRRAAANPECWTENKSTPRSKPLLDDALLTCGDQLRDRHPSEAKAIYRILATATQPHVRHAAEAGLRTIEPTPVQ